MRSIRRQLTHQLLAATCVLLGGGLAAVYLAARSAVLDQFDHALLAKALAISTVTRADRDGLSVDFHDRFLRGFDDDRRRDFFQLWDEAGRTIARSESLGRRRELEWHDARPGKPARWNLTLPNGEPGRAVAFAFEPAREDGAPRAKIQARLVVASEREELDETLWQLLGLAAGSGALLIGATLVLIPLVLRRGLRPLERLAGDTTRIDATSLATRLPEADLPRELQPIAARLNELLARLERSFERERRFSADLAHELRTPLAELRSLAECALKWPETRSPSFDRDALAIAEHMETLVTQMLALTRGEQGRLSAKPEPVAVDQLLADVWRGFAAAAAGRDLAVALTLPPANGVADPVLLRSVLGNLCANATDHAPAGGRVAIACRQSADGISIEVANTVVAFDPADVDRLFDRFWRKEAARGGPHLGLGLSLAQSFAAAMHWSLTARLEAGAQLVFTLRGPAAFPPPNTAGPAASGAGA